MRAYTDRRHDGAQRRMSRLPISIKRPTITPSRVRKEGHVHKNRDNPSRATLLPVPPGIQVGGPVTACKQQPVLLYRGGLAGRHFHHQQS